MTFTNSELQLTFFALSLIAVAHDIEVEIRTGQPQPGHGEIPG